MLISGYKRSYARWTALGSAWLLAVLGLVAAAPAAADDLKWSVYTGVWDLEKSGETAELGFEARRPLGAQGFDLVAGLAGTTDEAAWVYAGAALGWDMSDKWELRPGFAIGLFDEGDGKDLGGPVEFRSSLELTYRLRRSLHVGLLAYHLSNAGLYDLNPGSNSLVLVVGFQ